MLLLLLAATALVLSPVLFAGFIRLDDYSHLFDNPQLRRMSIAGLAALWSKAYFNLYIPLTYSVWWALTMLAGWFGGLHNAAWMFHALNLAVHLVSASLVFFLLRTLLTLRHPQASIACGASPLCGLRSVAGGVGDPSRVPTSIEIRRGDAAIALLSAAFFALHPVQVETVAWVSELKGGLAAMLGLLGLFSHYRTNRRVLTTVCFVAAMLAKPSAIVFPGIVFVVDRVLLGLHLRRSAMTAAIYAAPLLPFLITTKILQPDSSLDFVPTIPQRLLVAADALAFYVSKVLLPYPLAVDYGRSPRYVLEHVPGWWIALAVLLSAAGAMVVARAVLRPRPASPEEAWRSLLWGGWAVFMVSLVPILGLVPFGFQDVSTVADHYLYVPLLGGSMMVAGFLAGARDFAWSRRAAIVVVLVLAGLGFQQARLWRSTETLLAHTVAVNPRSYLGYESIADECLHTGRFAEAAAWSSRALAANPDYLNAHISHALARLNQGDVNGAIEQYESALARNPSSTGTRARLVSALHNNLGNALAQVGRRAEAIEHLHKAVEIFPKSVNAHLNLGNVAFDDGRYADAIAEYERARAVTPDNPMVERRLARARAAASERTAQPAP